MRAIDPEEPPTRIRCGTAHAMFAYDIGLAIDLDEAERRIRSRREFLRHKRRTPRYFEYQPHPLRVIQESEPIVLGEARTAPHVDLVLYDFGAVSVLYTIPLDGPLEGLVALSELLYDNAALLADSQRRVRELARTIATAVSRPSLAESVEPYTIFQLEELDPPSDATAFRTTHRATVARILRAERSPLSEDEVREAMLHCISYGPDDLTIVDWVAALAWGPDMDDVRAVLEFANVELLEMRCLDQRLDGSLDEAYQAMSRRSWRPLRRPGEHTDLHRVAQMQVDSAMLFEGVNNALKLVGDQYLARLYRLASQRFRLDEWDASIMRKLHTLDSIYEKISDVAAGRRMEILEWIIILLIAVSIVIPFVPGMGGSH